MPVFEVGDDVRQLDRVYERTLYGYVLEVWAERGLCLVQWGRSDPVTPATPLPHTSWEENCELLLEYRGGKESPMRKFTQEEKDYILNILADPTHDSYIAEHIVKDAKAVATRTRRANLARAAELIVNTLGVRRGNYGLSSVHESSVVRPGDEKHIEMCTSYGVYTITLREKV